jgi:hypothetical protein
VQQLAFNGQSKRPSRQRLVDAAAMGDRLLWPFPWSLLSFITEKVKKKKFFFFKIK